MAALSTSKGSTTGIHRVAIAALWLIVILILLLAVLWFVRLPIGNYVLDRQLAQAGLSLDGGRLTKLTFSEATLTGLKTADGGAIDAAIDDGLSAAELHLTYDWQELLNGRITSLTVSGLQATLDTSRLPRPGIGGGSTPPVTIENIIIEDARLALLTDKGTIQTSVNGTFNETSGGSFVVDLLPTSLTDEPTELAIHTGQLNLSTSPQGTVTLDGGLTADLVINASDAQGKDMRLNGIALQLDATNDAPEIENGWGGTAAITVAKLNIPALELLNPVPAMPELTQALREAGAEATLEGALRFTYANGTLSLFSDQPQIARLRTTSGVMVDMTSISEASTAPFFTWQEGMTSADMDITLRGGDLPSIRQRLNTTYADNTLQATASGTTNSLKVGPMQLAALTNNTQLTYKDGNTDVIYSGTTSYSIAYEDKARAEGGTLGFSGTLAMTGTSGTGDVTFTGANKCTRISTVAWRGTATATGKNARLCLKDKPLTFQWSLENPIEAAANIRLSAEDIAITTGNHTIAAPTIATDGKIALYGDRLTGNFTMAGQFARYNELFSFDDISLTATSSIQAGDFTAQADIQNVTINDLSENRQLAPIQLIGKAQYGADSVLRADGTLSTMRGVNLATLTGTHDLESNAGAVTLRADALAFQPGRLQPQNIVLSLKNFMTDVTGSMTARFDAVWQDENFTSTGTLSTAGLALNSRAGPIEGFSTTATFGNLFPPTTDGTMEARMDSLAIGVDLEDGQLAYALDENGDRRLEKLEWPWAGGIVGFYDTVIKKGSSDFFMNGEVQDVDVTALFDIIDVKGLEGDGKISGTLPVSFEDGKAYLRGARLSTTKPGTISYTSPTAQQLKATSEEGAELLLSAVENFEYDTLEVRADGPLLGDLDIQLVMGGRNPDVLYGSPFKITVRTKAAVPQIVTAARLGLGGQNQLNLLRDAARGGTQK